MLALVLAAAVFYGVREVGNFLVWRYYLDDMNKQERAENYMEEFQEYVVQHKLSIYDSEKISAWSGGNYVDIILYKDSSLIYAPDWFESVDGDPDQAPDTAVGDEMGTDADGETETGKESFDNQNYENWFSGDRGFVKYLTEEAREAYQKALENSLDENRAMMPVYFVDGTLLATVVDYSEEFLYNMVFAISLTAALIVVGAVMIFSFSKTLVRIKKLSSDVRLVEQGNLELPIRLEGNDEITSLASDVNSMRNSVLENMTKERQAWEANAALITAMSHDIRTPLTVLMGYLDLIELQNTDNACTDYIASCKENVLRLKGLSDDMFSYFLVFGKRDINLKPESVWADESLEHMIAERLVLFSEKGFTIVRRGDMPHISVSLDLAYFNRVVDNVFSNISKYADVTRDVTVSVDFDENTLKLGFENYIRTDSSIPESNGIGLKTCSKIMEYMGGRVTVDDDGERFVLRLYLSVEEKNDNISNT